MKIHLIDGTYELFRSFYGPPPKKAPDGREVGATVGLLRSLLLLIKDPDVTHVGCAFDHVVEFFRNDCLMATKPGKVSTRTCARSLVGRAGRGCAGNRGLADGGVRGR